MMNVSKFIKEAQRIEIRDFIKSCREKIPNFRTNVTFFAGKEVNIKLKKLRKMCSRRNDDK